jgi:hypothetical protein
VWISVVLYEDNLDTRSPIPVEPPIRSASSISENVAVGEKPAEAAEG